MYLIPRKFSKIFLVPIKVFDIFNFVSRKFFNISNSEKFFQYFQLREISPAVEVRVGLVLTTGLLESSMCQAIL